MFSEEDKVLFSAFFDFRHPITNEMMNRVLGFSARCIDMSFLINRLERLFFDSDLRIVSKAITIASYVYQSHSLLMKNSFFIMKDLLLKESTKTMILRMLSQSTTMDLLDFLFQDIERIFLEESVVNKRLCISIAYACYCKDKRASGIMKKMILRALFDEDVRLQAVSIIIELQNETSEFNHYLRYLVAEIETCSFILYTKIIKSFLNTINNDLLNIATPYIKTRISSSKFVIVSVPIAVRLGKSHEISISIIKELEKNVLKLKDYSKVSLIQELKRINPSYIPNEKILMELLSSKDVHIRSECLIIMDKPEASLIDSLVHVIQTRAKQNDYTLAYSSIEFLPKILLPKIIFALMNIKSHQSSKIVVDTLSKSKHELHKEFLSLIRSNVFALPNNDIGCVIADIISEFSNLQSDMYLLVPTDLVSQEEGIQFHMSLCALYLILRIKPQIEKPFKSRMNLLCLSPFKSVRDIVGEIQFYFEAAQIVHG